MARRAARLLGERRLVEPHRPLDDDEIWRITANSLAARIAVLDEHTQIIAVNDAWRSFALSEGASSDQVGSNYAEVCEAAGDPISLSIARGLRDVASGRAGRFECEYPCHSEVEQRWFLIRATRAASGSPARVVVSHEDVTDHHLSQNEVRSHSLLLDEVNAAVHTVDENRIVQSWNAGAARLFGWSAEEAIGRRVDELIVPEDARLDRRARKRAAEVEWEGDRMLMRKDGTTFPAHVRSRVADESPENGRSTIVVTIDITDRVLSERELKLARDHLRAVTRSLGEGMVTVDAAGQVTFMNPVAEAQLGWTAAELYGLDLHQVTHSRRRDGSAVPVEECQIMRACRDDAVVEVDDDIFIRADGTELEVAYTAAPYATADGVEGCVIVFRDVAERNAERRRMELEVAKLASIKRIRRALDGDRFVLFAQPIVEIDSGAVLQQELLIRMRDPRRKDGIIPPSDFLPVAEEFGLISEIDRWVIDQAATLAATGNPVELNVSGVSIGDPGLLPHIITAIERSGADPKDLVFEITETTLLENESAGHEFVDRLHEIGCGVALDDFGTGYGGFTYLKQLPIDIIKIDMEFVRDLTVNPASQNVVQAIVNLASSFELVTVAEGVENEETLTLLRDFGVDQAQGYHLGRPSPVESSAQHALRG
jgi:PAS domain S-box-containing protein